MNWAEGGAPVYSVPCATGQPLGRAAQCAVFEYSGFKSDSTCGENFCYRCVVVLCIMQANSDGTCAEGRLRMWAATPHRRALLPKCEQVSKREGAMPAPDSQLRCRQ